MGGWSQRYGVWLGVEIKGRGVVVEVGGAHRRKGVRKVVWSQR